MTMPTAKLIPARLTTFIVRPSASKTMKVPMTLDGIAIATIIVLLALLRKRRRTVMASTPPITRFPLTSFIAFFYVTGLFVDIAEVKSVFLEDAPYSAPQRPQREPP